MDGQQDKRGRTSDECDGTRRVAAGRDKRRGGGGGPSKGPQECGCGSAPA